MRVALVTAHMSRRAGGLAHSVPAFARALEGVEVRIVGIRDGLAPAEATAWGEIGWPQRAYGPRAFGWAPGMRRALAAFEPDVTDCQGLWIYPSLANLRHARQHRQPYVVTPRGMLDPWALRRSAWKKRLVGAWFERAHLRGATCIRALAPAELEAVRAFGLKGPVALVPNGVALPNLDDATRAADRPRTLLFLGRIHPKKGVGTLLRAWAQAQPETRAAGWRLQVTGWGETEHVRQVERLADSLELDRAGFALTGPRFGEAKEQCFRDASAFVLPSYSEGLPMAVLEAWSYGLPALLTEGCNLPEGFARNAALRVEPTTESLVDGIRTLARSSDTERSQIGAAGRRLVAERFAWPRVAAAMREVYEWTSGGGQPPDCVATD